MESLKALAIVYIHYHAFSLVCISIKIRLVTSNPSPLLAEFRKSIIYSYDLIFVLSSLPLAFSFPFLSLSFPFLFANLEINLFMNIALSLCINSRNI